MTFSGDVGLNPVAFPAAPGVSAAAAGDDRGGAQHAALAIARETLMLGEMVEVCYPAIADAKAIPSGTMMSRLVLARRPLQPAWTEVRFVELAREKRNEAQVTRDFAIRHRLRWALR
jgi:hypothetical protein